MGNKDFHPSNIRNLKKVWEAKEKQKHDQKRQEEMKAQYRKEQEMYHNKELMGKANPMSFMYEPPPGFSKEKEEKDDQDKEKLKFDWQRSDRAPPREEYAKSMDIHDQPFGIEVRNVKCFKCGKWGHVNTDRICPMYGQNKSQEDLESSLPKSSLADLDTAEDGFIFKQCVRDRVINSGASNQQILASDDDDNDISQQILDQLSDKDKRKLLKCVAVIGFGLG
jgi:hypothetical protein